MAHDMFMKIDDIKGESQDAAHKDEIDVVEFKWGMTQTGTAHVGPGGTAGKVQVKDLFFTKYVDRATSPLAKLCASGKHLKTAVLTLRKAGGTPIDYLKITLEDLIVASITHGGAKDDDRFTEDVTLNFARMKMEYVPQKADGTGDASVHMGWDVAGNKEHT